MNPQHRVDAAPQLLQARFGFGDAGHVGKGDEHAVDRPLRGTIGQDAHQVMRPAVAAGDAARAALPGCEHRLGFLPQIEIDDAADDVGQRPPAIDVLQVEDSP